MLMTLHCLLILIVAATPTSTTSTKPMTTGPATRQAATASSTTRRTLPEATRVYEQAIDRALRQHLEAQIAAKRAYVADLSLAVNVAMQAGNLQKANEAKALRDEVTTQIEQISQRLRTGSEIPIGTWEVAYSNGTSHTCRIGVDGTWEKLQSPGTPPARVRVAENGDVLVNFRDGDQPKVERLMLTTSGLLVIEHFNPPTLRSTGKPVAIGIGRRVRTEP
jgi:hypothetical protein